MLESLSSLASLSIFFLNQLIFPFGNTLERLRAWALTLFLIFLFFFIVIRCWEHVKNIIFFNAVPDPIDWTLVQPIVKLFRHRASFRHQSRTTMYCLAKYCLNQSRPARTVSQSSNCSAPIMVS